MNLKDNQIKVCLGTGCYTRGATKILAEFEKQLGVKLGETTEDKISLGLIRCIGRCAQAPIAQINEQICSELTPKKVSEILTSIKED